MTWSYGIGWLFLITFMLTFHFHIADPEVISTAPPGWVWTFFDQISAAYLCELTHKQQLLLILQQATKHRGATTFIMFLCMLTSLGAYFNTVASLSRLIWQFCRSSEPNDSNSHRTTLTHLTAKDRDLPHFQSFTQVCS